MWIGIAIGVVAPPLAPATAVPSNPATWDDMTDTWDSYLTVTWDDLT